MDDEEAKRIQEERDKQIKKEYDDVTNPKEPDWDVIDPPMKGQGLVNEALMIGGSRLAAAAINPILKTIGPAGVIDAGINIITGESDTPFEKKLEIFKPAKVAVKSTRLIGNMLTDVFDKRVAKPVIESLPADKVFATNEGIPKPSPKPDWTEAAKTGQLGDEKIVMQNALADELVVDATGKHISKRQEAAYKFLGKFRAEWNKWSKNNNYIHEFADKDSTAYVEHLVGKDKYYDPFWALPNEKRFRKGSRHGPYNVRILYNNRMKSFKDASESILKKLHKPKDPMDFILLDWEIDVPPKGSIAIEAAPRDLLVKRVDGTIIGRLGDYHDILYASNNQKVMGEFETLQYKLGAHINPRTGKPYIDLTQSQDNINQQISNWREKIIKDKLQLILNEEKTLKGMDEASKFQRQSEAVNKDMVDTLKEYEFIKPSKGFEDTYKNEQFSYDRGGKPIPTPNEGIFMDKTTEMKINRARYKGGRMTKELLDNILRRNE